MNMEIAIAEIVRRLPDLVADTANAPEVIRALLEPLRNTECGVRDESELRRQFAIHASDEDVNSILRDNIQNFTIGKKVHGRESARWEFADRCLAAEKPIASRLTPNA